MILGHTSRIGTGSNRRHYELSSRGRASRNASSGILTNTFVGGGTSGPRKASDSEDELVKGEGVLYGASEPNGVVERLGKADEGGIRVETQFRVSEEIGRMSVDKPGR